MRQRQKAIIGKVCLHAPVILPPLGFSSSVEMKFIGRFAGDLVSERQLRERERGKLLLPHVCCVDSLRC